jgi:hypothetical protein
MQECHHPAGAVWNDEYDAAPGTPAQSLARQKLAAPVKQDCARRRVVNIDPEIDALHGGTVINFESAAPDAH